MDNKGQTLSLPSFTLKQRMVRLAALPVMSPTLPEAVAKLEREMMIVALETTLGHKKHAARILGMSDRVFRYRAHQLGLIESDEPVYTLPEEWEQGQTIVQRKNGRETMLSVKLQVDLSHKEDR
jgi:hypothetical protein